MAQRQNYYSSQYYDSTPNRSRSGWYPSYGYENDNDYNDYSDNALRYNRRLGSDYGRNEYDVGNDDYEREMRYGRSGIESNRDYDRNLSSGYRSGLYDRDDYNSGYGDSGYYSEPLYNGRLRNPARYYGQGIYQSRRFSGRNYGSGYNRDYEDYNERNLPRGSYSSGYYDESYDEPFFRRNY